MKIDISMLADSHPVPNTKTCTTDSERPALQREEKTGIKKFVKKKKILHAFQRDKLVKHRIADSSAQKKSF